MKARKKVLFYSFILSLFFISLCLIIFSDSSASLDKNKRIITFWHAMDGQRGDILRQLISEFNRNHPKIKVEERFISSSTLLAGNNYHALYSEILRSLALKQSPNIAQVYENWTTQFIEYKAIVPIEDYVKGVNGLNVLELNDIFPVFLDANTFNEKLWTIPFNKSIYVLFYNKDLFSKFNFQVPKTWDELLGIAKKLTFEKGDNLHYGLVFTPNVDILGHLIYSKGGEFINSNQAIFNDSIGLESLNYLRKLVDDKIAMYSFSAFDDFVNQKSAMYIETTSKLAALRKKAKFNFKISVLPQGKERNYQFAGTNLAIFSTTQEEQELSWEFIKWLINKENSMKWAYLTGYLPIYQSIIDELKFKEYFKNEKEYFEAISALKYAKVQPKVAVWENIRGFIDDAVYNCVSGKLSPQEALDKAVAMANKILRTEK